MISVKIRLVRGGTQNVETNHLWVHMCVHVCIACMLHFHWAHTDQWRLCECTWARVEASARICLVCLFVCFADVGVERRGGGVEGWLLMCKCASCWRAVNGEVWRKKGPERRCLSRGCQRHSMSYSWGLPFKATAPAQLPRDWEKIKLFGSQR